MLGQKNDRVATPTLVLKTDTPVKNLARKARNTFPKTAFSNRPPTRADPYERVTIKEALSLSFSLTKGKFEAASRSQQA